MLLFDGKTDSVITDLGGRNIKLMSTASVDLEKMMDLPPGVTLAAWAGNLLTEQSFQFSSASVLAAQRPLCLSSDWDNRGKRIPKSERWNERIHGIHR